MAEREPTVIERMRWAYIHAINAEIDGGNKDYDDAGRKAMLAAVRELQKAADVKFGDDCLVVDDMTRAEASIWLRVVIRDHDAKQALRDHEQDSDDG